MKPDIDIAKKIISKFKNKFFLLLVVGFALVVSVPLHESIGVFRNLAYGNYDISILGLGLLMIIISLLKLKSKIPLYLWTVIFILGIFLSLLVPINEVFSGNGFYGIYDQFLFALSIPLTVFGLFGIYDKKPVMLVFLGAFIGSAVVARYNPYSIANWFFYAVIVIAAIFYILFWSMFEPPLLLNSPAQTLSIALTGLIALILPLHELLLPTTIWSVGWFVLLLSTVPIAVLALLLMHKPDMPWLRQNYFYLGTMIFLIITGFFLRAYFNLGPATEHGFSFVGTDPYYHARVVDYVVENKEHIIWDNLLNYPLQGTNPRPPLFDWFAAIFGLILIPLFGGNAHTSAMYALTISPAIWGALTLIPIYYLGKELFGRKAGLLAAFLLAVMPDHIQGTGLGLADHDPFYMFFVVCAFFFLVKTLRTLNEKRWVANWKSIKNVRTGLKECIKNNKIAISYSALAGFSILTVALTWEGHIYIFAIIFIYYIAQLIINHLRHEDSLALSLAMLTVIIIPTALSIFSAPYCMGIPTLFIGILQGSMPAHWYIVTAIIILSIIFVPTRDFPWLLFLPAIVLIGAVSYLILWQFQPGLAFALFGGFGYILKTKVYGTIGEAQATDLNRCVFAYGMITFYLTLAAVFILLVKYIKSWKKDILLISVWGITATWMTLSAVRFMFNATPIYAVLPAWLICEIIAKTDFKTMQKNIHAMSGERFRALKKGMKLKHIACVLFVVFCIMLPNAYGAIDAGIPYEKKGEYDKMIYDWLPDWAKQPSYSGMQYLGTHGQGFLSGYWVDGLAWLATQDTDLPVEKRPAFIAWWDYGFQCVQDGKHPTIADNFQNGIPPAGNFITAQNETRAITVFITRILHAQYIRKGGISTEVSDILKRQLGNETAKKLENIIATPDNYLPDVLAGFDKCHERTDDIGDRGSSVGLHMDNTMYAGAMILFADIDKEKIVNLLHDIEQVTDYSIRYFAADSRMFPFNWANTGIYYAPTVLSDQNVSDFFEVMISGEEVDSTGTVLSTTGFMAAGEFVEWRDSPDVPTQHNRRAHDYRLQYKEAFYNSMFYRAYIGYSGLDLGYDTETFGIPGISPDMSGRSDWIAYQQGYPIMPCWMQEHFRIVYLNSGLRIVEYYEGAEVQGRVITATGEPIANAHVTVFDDFGIPHDRAETNESGFFTLLAPFGRKENNYDITLVASMGEITDPTQKLQQVGTVINTTVIKVTEEQAFREENSMWQIKLDLTVKPASLEGTVVWDGNAIPNCTVILKRGNTPVNNTTTKLDGSYEIKDIAPGNYEAFVNISNREIKIKDISFAADQHKSGDDGKLEIKSGAVGFNVIYENGTDANADISVQDLTNHTYINGSSENGTFTAQKLLPGNYSISVYKKNFLRYEEEFLLQHGEFKQINVTLYSSTRISGNISAEGKPIQDATVKLRSSERNEVYRVRSNETGFYELELKKGNYTVNILHTENNITWIFAGELELINEFYDYNITLERAAKIYGNVFYKSNQTENETLARNTQVIFKSENYNFTAPVNSTGYYEIYLPAENYTVMIVYEDNETTFVHLDKMSVSSGEFKKHNFSLSEGVRAYGAVYYDQDETKDKLVGNVRLIFTSENGSAEVFASDGRYEIYLAGNRTYNITLDFAQAAYKEKDFEEIGALPPLYVNDTSERKEIEHNISLDPKNVTLTGSLTCDYYQDFNLTLWLNTTDDVGINTSLTLNPTSEITNYTHNLNPGRYEVVVNYTGVENNVSVRYYYHDILDIDVGASNISYNISLEKEILVKGIAWVDVNENGILDIVNETNETDHIVINEICYNTTDPKAAWFELYNPTNSSVNITDWKIWFLHCDGPISIPQTIIQPNEYVILCYRKENFTAYWSVSGEIQIVDLNDNWGVQGDSMWITEENGQLVDEIAYAGVEGCLPSTLLNHSRARYKNGYDTDNFTNDFYDESNPTPGYENNKLKMAEIRADVVVEFIADNVSYSAVTDVNGSYEIYLKIGNYTVFGNYTLENITYIYFGVLNASVHLVQAQINITFVKAVKVVGIAHYENENISGITIEFIHILSNHSTTTVTNVTGGYEILLMPGNYTISVNHTKYEKTTADVIFANLTYTNTSWIWISEDSEWNISLEREVRVKLSGTVSYNNTDISGVANAILVAYSEELNITLNTTTDQAGNYALWLEPSSYNITLAQPGFFNFSIIFNASIDNHTLDIYSELTNVTLFGMTYYDANKNREFEREDFAIPNVKIEIIGMGLNTTSNSAGFYEVSLPIGTYDIYTFYITSWGNAYGCFDKITITPSEKTEYNISMTKSFSISGRLYYYNQSGISTTLTSLNLTIDNIKTVPAAGEYQLYLPEGEHEITANFTTPELGMNITYAYNETINVRDNLLPHDLNLTKVLRREVNISWDDIRRTVGCNETLQYNLTIINLGNTEDVFELIAENPPPNWHVEFYPANASLNLHQSANIIVNITSAVRANAGENRITLTARSIYDSEAKNSVDVFVNITQFWGLNITCAAPEKGIRWNSSENYTTIPVTITNEGNGLDTVNLSISGNIPEGWNVSLSEQSVSVVSYALKEVVVNVFSPINASQGQMISFTVHGVNAKGNTSYTSLTAMVSLPDLAVVSVELSNSHPSTNENITINVTVENQGLIDSVVEEGFAVILFVDDKEVDRNTSINRLGAKENITLQFNWTSPSVSGKYNIKVGIEPANSSAVFSEFQNRKENNYLTKTILVGEEKIYWRLITFITGIIVFLVSVIMWRKIRKRR